MKIHRRMILWSALSLTTLLVAAATIDTHWRDNLLQWRADRAKHLTAPDGWLSLVGLEWLQPGTNTLARLQTIASGSMQWWILTWACLISKGTMCTCWHLHRVCL